MADTAIFNERYEGSAQRHDTHNKGNNMREMNRRLRRLLALMAALALLAGACGSDDDSSDADGDATTTTAAPEETTAAPAAEVPGLVEEGKLIVVTTGNFPPFTAIDPDTGENVGYTIDIVREVANRLGLELELV